MPTRDCESGAWGCLLFAVSQLSTSAAALRYLYRLTVRVLTHGVTRVTAPYFTYGIILYYVVVSRGARSDSFMTLKTL